jgi:mono/diheme cytochrome c family protein
MLRGELTFARFCGCSHPGAAMAHQNLLINYLDAVRYDVRMPWITVALFLFSAVSAVFAQDTPRPSDSTLTGNPVYQKNCAKCHGKSAEGRHFGGPSIVSKKTADASADDLGNIISNGKGRMPKYTGKLSSEEINRLILQIKAANTK